MNRRRPSRSRRPPAGYTLMETVVALGVLAVVMLTIASLSMFTARSFEALGNYSGMDSQSSFALDTLGKDIRRASGVVYYDTNQIVLTNLSGMTVTNAWDPVTGLVTRSFQGITRDLLTECDYFAFQMSKRNPSNDFALSPTADPAQAKVITVTWRCSRPVYGMNRTNTESLQTAQFVIRN